MIAVDLDSTLYDFESPAREKFLELANERDDKTLLRGVYVPWVEWRSPADATGIDNWLEVIRRVHDDECISEQTPYKGAVETLQALAETHNLIYISNRATERYQATFDWLSDWEFPIDGDHKLVCTAEDKMPYIAKCQYLIDDRPKTLVEFVYNYQWRNSFGADVKPRKAFGLMFDYNRALTDVPNIYLAPSWRGVNHYLVEKGVIKERVSV